jgi:hypothetical protein
MKSRAGEELNHDRGPQGLGSESSTETVPNREQALAEG